MLLNLKTHIWEQNLIKNITKYFHPFDWEMIMLAHNSKKEKEYIATKKHLCHCAQHGYLGLIRWMKISRSNLCRDFDNLAIKGGHLGK